MTAPRHQLLLGGLLLANIVVFGGVDPPLRVLTAAAALALALDLGQLPSVPRSHRIAGALLVGLAVVQLVPLPEALRGWLQPGLREVFAEGWAPLSVAPWATAQFLAAVVVTAVVALTAARMATTRSGLPALVRVLAAAGGLLGLLGLVGEASLAERRILWLRDVPRWHAEHNVAGWGDAYGPLINSNHFALAVELTLPAAVVLLAAAARHVGRRDPARHRAVATVLAAAAILAVEGAALARSGSRGGLLFCALAGAATLPLWRGRGRRRRLLVAGAVAAALLGVAAMTWTWERQFRDQFSDPFVIGGVTVRWDLWLATLETWQRAPLPGVGLGAFRYAFPLDQPPAGSAVFRQAHSDWLEMLATGGVAAAAAMALLVVGGITAFRHRRVRSDLRYPLAAAAWVLLATALHSQIGYGLQTPGNRYLLAAWVGLAWGIDRRLTGARRDVEAGEATGAAEPGEDDDR